jgi:hypothetical protein
MLVRAVSGGLVEASEKEAYQRSDGGKAIAEFVELGLWRLDTGSGLRAELMECRDRARRVCEKR